MRAGGSRRRADAVTHLIDDASEAIDSCTVGCCLRSFANARPLARSQFIPCPAWQAPLSANGALTGAAYSHAQNLAARQRLDHAGFRQRVSLTSGAAAENVAYGCATEDCVIRMWARSGRHRANMLRRDVKSYGIASAVGANGKRYWVLELGN
jgi:Cysteine-rich secretory protein family